jgi:glycerol uptake operon antiterminator
MGEVDVSDRHNCPIIAGGLIREEKEVKELTEYGVMAVSSSDRDLWNFNLEDS